MLSYAAVTIEGPSSGYRAARLAVELLDVYPAATLGHCQITGFGIDHWTTRLLAVFPMPLDCVTTRPTARSRRAAT